MTALYRGLSPYPAAHTTLEREDEAFNIKIFDSLPIIEKHNYSAETIVQLQPKQINVAVANGFVKILELQLQGRKRMKAVDFLNGFPLLEKIY